MRCAGRIGMLAGVFVTLGCDSNRLIMGPPSPPPVPFTAPPIRGTIRETNGGPIGNLQIEMTGTGSVRLVDSDAQGGFFFPYSSNPCGGASVAIDLDRSD